MKFSKNGTFDSFDEWQGSLTIKSTLAWASRKLAILEWISSLAAFICVESANHWAGVEFWKGGKKRAHEKNCVRVRRGTSTTTNRHLPKAITANNPNSSELRTTIIFGIS